MLGLSLILLSGISMILFLSPSKISFSATLLSILTSLYTYSTMNCVFTSSAVVISFSSGMMIAFCYCSMMTQYEEKPFNLKYIYTILLIMTTFIVTISPLEMLSNTQEPQTMSSFMTSSPMVVMAMGVVLLTMLSMNYKLFQPSKVLTTSY